MPMTSEITTAMRVTALRRGWYPVARSEELDSPQAATLLGTRLVAFRTAGGVARVLANRCPHRGGAMHLGSVADDALECPYHGWQWRGSDGACVYIPSNGAAAAIPKTARTPFFPAVERFGLVWTCVGEPLGEVPVLPELDPLDMTYAAGEPVDVAAGIVAATENFRDVAHFPFVHRGTMGEVAHRVEAFDVQRSGFETWMTRTYSASNGNSELFRDVENLTFNYHAIAPGLSSVLLDHGRGGKRVVMECFAPLGPTGCRIFLVSGTAAGYTELDPESTLKAEMAVLHEDLPTLETLEPLEVPFNREQPEVSVEADRYTLATRRAFAEFILASDVGAADAGEGAKSS